MMQNTVFNDATLWVFILLFSIFFARLETVHNIEGASCELSISKMKKWQAANKRGSHSTRPAGVPTAKVASDWTGLIFDISRLYMTALLLSKIYSQITDFPQFLSS